MSQPLLRWARQHGMAQDAQRAQHVQHALFLSSQRHWQVLGRPILRRLARGLLGQPGSSSGLDAAQSTLVSALFVVLGAAAGRLLAAAGVLKQARPTTSARLGSRSPYFDTPHTLHTLMLSIL
jgi:hypothetical protein